MRIKKRDSIFIFASIVYMLELVLYYYLMNNNSISFNYSYSGIIKFLSILGVIQYFYVILTWYKSTDQLFCGYVIYTSFAYLFTYGQCFMWAFNIHFEREIGRVNLYYFEKPSEIEVIKTQIFTLISLASFHYGAITNINKKNKFVLLSKKSINNTVENRVLYTICKIMCIISTPVQYYLTIIAYMANKSFGYGALLYNDNFSGTQNSVLAFIQLLYFPSLFGLLIASNYNKKTVVICYLNFIVFTLLSIAGGNRGEWLIPLIIFVWMSNVYYKKISIKNVFAYCFIGIVVLMVGSIISKIRDYGVSFNSILMAMTSQNNIISSAFFEMGSSMIPTLLMLREGPHFYPYGNTYFLSLLGIVTERIIRIFIPDYLGIAGWYSKEYLKITYGAGFSFVAEAYVNYGENFSLIALFIMGYIMSKLLNVKKDLRQHSSIIYSFFQISSCYALMEGIRNSSLHALRIWFYSTVVVYVMLKIISNQTIVNNKKVFYE